MSTPAPDGSEGGGQRPRGFSRFIRRASIVLRRDKSKRQSMSGTTAPAAVGSGSATTGAPVPAQQPTQATTTSTTPIAPPVSGKDEGNTKDTTGAKDTKDSAVPPAPLKPKSAMTAAENNNLQEEKARAMFAKYNMTLEIGEWVPPFKGDAVRVEKQVRMRVHRHCHRCQVMFGKERQCANCSHTRCKKCPKTQTSRQKDRKGKTVLTGGIVVDDRYMGAMGSDLLSMPYRRTVRDLPGSGTIRRVCHKCQTIFVGNAPQCGACGHARCAQCPQDPPLSHPMAENGLPRRRQMREIRVRVRYTCHECQKIFKDLETKCSNCAHAKCSDCFRSPAVEEIPEVDPEVLSRVEERLRNLEVSPQAAAA